MSELSLESNRPIESRLAVWVDHFSDTGDGLAVELSSTYFAMAEDGLVCTIDREGRVPGLSIDGIVVVDEIDEGAVVEAAEEAADENIFLHFVRTSDDGTITHLWNADTAEWEPYTAEPSYPKIKILDYVLRSASERVRNRKLHRDYIF
jgi:hypothetical protein